MWCHGGPQPSWLSGDVAEECFYSGKARERRDDLGLVCTHAWGSSRDVAAVCHGGMAVNRQQTSAAAQKIWTWCCAGRRLVGASAGPGHSRCSAVKDVPREMNLISSGARVLGGVLRSAQAALLQQAAALPVERPPSPAELDYAFECEPASMRRARPDALSRSPALEAEAELARLWSACETTPDDSDAGRAALDALLSAFVAQCSGWSASDEATQRALALQSGVLRGCSAGHPAALLRALCVGADGAVEALETAGASCV